MAKIERWQGTKRTDAIRQSTPGTRKEADRVVATFVEHHNHKRLHSAIDCVTPADRLAGRHKAINEARGLKLVAALQQRAAWRQGRPPFERERPLTNRITRIRLVKSSRQPV